MIRFLLLTVFLLPICLISAQESPGEWGFVFAPRMQGETDFGIKINGFSVESGVYYSLPFGERISLSLNTRLGYTYSDRRMRGTLALSNAPTFTWGATHPMRYGTIRHRNFYLSLPVQLRFQPLRKSRAYLLLAIHPEFNLWHSSDWNFDQYDWDSGTNNRTLLETGLQEELPQSIYASALSLGVGHSWGGWRMEMEVRLGGHELESSYFKGVDYQAFGVAVYRRMN